MSLIIHYISGMIWFNVEVSLIQCRTDWNIFILIIKRQVLVIFQNPSRSSRDKERSYDLWFLVVTLTLNQAGCNIVSIWLTLVVSYFNSFKGFNSYEKETLLENPEETHLPATWWPHDHLTCDIRYQTWVAAVRGERFTTTPVGQPN